MLLAILNSQLENLNSAVAIDVVEDLDEGFLRESSAVSLSRTMRYMSEGKRVAHSA